jgi:hypothetical protein
VVGRRRASHKTYINRGLYTICGSIWSAFSGTFWAFSALFSQVCVSYGFGLFVWWLVGILELKFEVTSSSS